MIRKELLDILACPKCKGPVVAHNDPPGSSVENVAYWYEIVDDIPVMLIDKAKNIQDENEHGH